MEGVRLDHSYCRPGMRECSVLLDVDGHTITHTNSADCVTAAMNKGNAGASKTDSSSEKRVDPMKRRNYVPKKVVKTNNKSKLARNLLDDQEPKKNKRVAAATKNPYKNVAAIDSNAAHPRIKSKNKFKRNCKDPLPRKDDSPSNTNGKLSCIKRETPNLDNDTMTWQAKTRKRKSQSASPVDLPQEPHSTAVSKKPKLGPSRKASRAAATTVDMKLASRILPKRHKAKLFPGYLVGRPKRGTPSTIQTKSLDETSCSQRKGPGRPPGKTRNQKGTGLFPAGRVAKQSRRQSPNTSINSSNIVTGPCKLHVRS